MGTQTVPRKLPFSYKLKKSVVSIALLALGVTFVKVSNKDKELQEELENWTDNLVFSLGVLPKGPAITLKHVNGRIKYLGRGYKEDPELKILFKNVDSAFLPFTGQMGSHTAFVQHRALLHGNVVDGIKANRAMNIVQKYLLPKIVLNFTFKRPPKYTFRQLILKLNVYMTMGLGIALNATK